MLGFAQSPPGAADTLGAWNSAGRGIELVCGSSQVGRRLVVIGGREVDSAKRSLARPDPMPVKT